MIHAVFDPADLGRVIVKNNCNSIVYIEGKAISYTMNLIVYSIFDL